jgi:hypothetical protein
MPQGNNYTIFGSIIDHIILNLQISATNLYIWSQDSAVGIATRYELDDRKFGVRVPVWARIFSSPRRPDRLWGSLNLLSHGYKGFFPRE